MGTDVDSIPDRIHHKICSLVYLTGISTGCLIVFVGLLLCCSADAMIGHTREDVMACSQ